MPVIKPPSHDRSSDDDELDELPPIDGDEIEDDDAAGAEELDDEPEDGGDPLDDSTGEDDPLEELEDSGSESGWLDDAGDSDGLDVGTPDTFGAEEESSTLLEGADGADETAVGEDDLPFADAEGASVVGDAGEEGFDEEDEEAVREEDLPRLDSGQDDSADADDADLLESLPDEDVTEEPRPPWDDRAWERVDGGPTGVPAVDVLASGPDGIVVGGQGLGRIERAGGGVTALEAAGFRGGAPRSIAIDGNWLFVATQRAGLLVSEDAGKSFREANGWREQVGEREVAGPFEALLVGGDLWGRAARGTLVWSGDRGRTWTSPLPGRPVDAFAADTKTGEIVAIARTGPDGATTLVHGTAGNVVTSSGGALPEGKIVSLAAYEGRLAVAMGRGAFRRDEVEGHEDEPWSRLDGTAGLTAMTFARGDGTLLIALHAEGEARAWLLEARSGAPALTVAEVVEAPGGASGVDGGEDGDDARVRALCWDGVAGVVWAAGGFGLTALRPSRR